MPLKTALRSVTFALVLSGIQFATPGAGAATPPSSQADDFFTDAQAQIAAGNPRAAMIQLRNALQQNPKHAGARALLGRLHLAAGDAASAEKELRRAVELHRSAEVEILLARALLMMAKPDEALAALTAEPANAQQSADQLLLRGDARVALGQPQEAEKLYEAALAAAPDSTATRLALARLDARRGRYDEAELRIAKLIGDDPGNLDAWLLRSDISLRQNRLDDMLEAVGEAGKLAPEDMRVLLSQATALLRSGQADRALAPLDKVLAKHPQNVAANYLLATIEAARGRYADADRVLIGIERSVAGYAPALLLTGIVKAKTGQYSQAERSLARYMTANPGDQAARRLLATVHLRLDNPHSAIETLQPLLAEGADDIPATGIAANAYLRAREFVKAAAMFEVIASSGQMPAAQQARAALSLLEIVQQSGSNPVAEGVLLALDLIRVGDPEGASAQVAKLRRDHPDSAVVRNIEGAVAFARGDLADARKSFVAALELDPAFAAAENNLDQLDLREGRAADVIRRLHERLDRNPSDDALALRLAELLAREGRTPEAVARLEKIANGPKPSLPVLQALLRLHAQQHDMVRVVAVAERLLEFSPADPAALAAAGQGFVLAAQTDRGIDAFRRMVALQSESVAGRVQLAQALAAAGQRDEARATLEEAQKLDAANAVPTAMLADFAMQDGAPDRALRIADALGAAQPVAAAQIKARLLQRMNRADEALTLLLDTAERHPDARMVQDLFQARLRAGKAGAAVTELRQWIATNPGDRAARLMLANHLSAAGKPEEAAKEFAALLSMMPNDPIVLNNYAWTLHQTSDPRAVELARRAYEKSPTSPEIADTLGWILVQTSRTAEGLPLIRQAAEWAPKNLDIQMHLAIALRSAGDRAEAIRILTRIAGLDQAFAERNDVGSILAELRR